MSTVFFDRYRLATVTSSIPTGDNFSRRPKHDMDKLIKNELRMGADNIDKRVLWEENLKHGRTKSILDVLIPRSNPALTTEELLSIRYIKKKDEKLVYGAPILQTSKSKSTTQWTLDHPFARQNKKPRMEPDCDTDVEVDDEDSMMETDGSNWSQQSFRVGKKRSNFGSQSTDEKNWERLLQNIYHAMRRKFVEADKLCILPKLYWSSEFSTTPIPDDTDARKPDLVLFDYRLKKLPVDHKNWSNVLTVIELTSSELFQGRDISAFLGVATEGYLIMREQPWRCFVLLFSIANFKLRAHYLDRSGMIISDPVNINQNPVRFVEVLNAMTLSDFPTPGFDPTIHICTDLCCSETKAPHNEQTRHNGSPGVMPKDAKGWIMGDEEDEVFWIMDIVWKSRDLFSRGTVCYRVQDKDGQVLALKDCWVDENSLEDEVTLLKLVEGVPNVVRLVKYWDVKHDGLLHCTSRIREHMGVLPDELIHCNKVHRRMLLTPCGLPLTTFKSVAELVSVFRDLVVAHEIMVTERKVLHGDLSPNNLVIHEGKGYFIDFDHAKSLNDGKGVVSRGTGTIPYISNRLLQRMGSTEPPYDHRASDDLESLFYIFFEFVIVYGGPEGDRTDAGVLPFAATMWRQAYETLDREGLWISGALKQNFLTDTKPDYQVAPYFRNCSSMVEGWRKAIASTIRAGGDVTHNEIIEVIDQCLRSITDMQMDRTLSPNARPPSSSG